MPKGTLRDDGPTIEEWVAAGYSAANYPPFGYESKSSPEDIEAVKNGTKVVPPRVNKDINPDMPDIASENDVANLKRGTRFLARFINDPKGDTGRHTRENLPLLKSGKMIRHNLSPDYWTNHALDRPPIAISKGNGKWELLE